MKFERFSPCDWGLGRNSRGSDPASGRMLKQRQIRENICATRPAKKQDRHKSKTTSANIIPQPRSDQGVWGSLKSFPGLVKTSGFMQDTLIHFSRSWAFVPRQIAKQTTRPVGISTSLCARQFKKGGENPYFFEGRSLSNTVLRREIRPEKGGFFQSKKKNLRQIWAKRGGEKNELC